MMKYLVILSLAAMACAKPLSIGSPILVEDKVVPDLRSNLLPASTSIFRTAIMPEIQNHIGAAFQPLTPGVFWNEDPLWAKNNLIGRSFPSWVPFNPQDPLWATKINLEARTMPIVEPVISGIQDPLWASKAAFLPKMIETLPINEDPLWATKMHFEPTMFGKTLLNEDPLWATKFDFSMPLNAQIMGKSGLGAEIFHDDPLWATKEAGKNFLMTGAVA